MFGTLEGLGYWWEGRTAQSPLGWTLVASRRMNLQIDGSEERTFHRFQPNELYHWNGIPVRINSKGFRTEEFSASKPPDCYRILNIGDSVAFGWGVRQEESYGKVLEEALRKHNPRACIEVINAAVPGWTLEDERNFLVEEGLGYQPDLVLLDFTLVNDVRGRRLAEERERTLFHWLRDHTYSWPFFTTQVRFLLARRWGPEAIPVLNPPQQADAYFPLEESSPIWNKTWGFVQEMNSLCKERDIRFMMIIFPTAFQLNQARHPTLPQEIYREFARRDQVELLDPFPTFRDICQSRGEKACDGYQNLLFEDVWMHPSPLGHRLVSELILNSLEGTV